MHVNIPYMLDNWADLLVHLFLLKSSMPTIGRTVLVTLSSICYPFQSHIPHVLIEHFSVK